MSGNSRRSNFSIENVVNFIDSNELQGIIYFPWVMYYDSNLDVQFVLGTTSVIPLIFRIDCLIWIFL